MQQISKFESRLRFIFGLAFAVIFSTIAVSIFVISELNENGRWVAHCHQVIAKLNAVQVDFSSARVSTKNYLLTRQARHLAPRINGFQAISEEMALIKALTCDNPRQQQHIKVVLNNIFEYDKLTSGIISEVDSIKNITYDKFGEWTEKTEPVARMVNASIVVMKKEEERLLDLREKVATSFVNEAYSIMPFMLATQMVITAYIYYGVLNQCESELTES